MSDHYAIGTRKVSQDTSTTVPVSTPAVRGNVRGVYINRNGKAVGGGPFYKRERTQEPFLTYQVF